MNVILTAATYLERSGYGTKIEKYIGDVPKVSVLPEQEQINTDYMIVYEDQDWWFFGCIAVFVVLLWLIIEDKIFPKKRSKKQ